MSPNQPSTSATDNEKFRSELAALIPASHASIVSFAAEALKATALITGGSAAATLAFMGSLASSKNFELASWLPWSLKMFVSGLFATCFATCFSYLAQALYGKVLMDVRWSADPIAARFSNSTRWMNYIALFFKTLAIASIVVAYVALIVGYAAAYRAITTVGFH